MTRIAISGLLAGILIATCGLLAAVPLDTVRINTGRINTGPVATGSIDTGSVSGALRVHSTNPRYFADDSGRPILLSGSHTWSVFQDLEHPGRRHQRRYSSYRAWLTSLERWNHNFTRGWVWEDGYYSPLPYRRVGKRWRLDQGNPDFIDRLVSRVRKAESRGLYTSIMLFQGWSVSSKGPQSRPRRAPDPLPFHPFSASRNLNDVSADINGDGQGFELHEATGRILDYQRNHVARLVEAMRPFGNIIWEIANEAHPGSLAWQISMAHFIRQLEEKYENRHLIWMSCLAGGGAAENEALFSGPADVVSPCNDSDAPYLDNPPRSMAAKIVIADSDHIAPGKVRMDWAWKSFLRGLHPIYMDLAADGLPWYRGTELQQDPRIAEQMRRALGAIQKLSARLPLAAMAPQGSAQQSPVENLDGSPSFALFSAASPASSNATFDGDELLAFEATGGGGLEICGLVPESAYTARWLRPTDGTGVNRPDRFTTARPKPGLPLDPKTLCRQFTNPDAEGRKLLHLRRTRQPLEGKPAPRTVQ